MQRDVNLFSFESGLNPSFKDGLIVQIPSNISSRQELFDIYADKLSFPSYFGSNWDALYDLLCDLSWIWQRCITIRHEALPGALGEKDMRIYLSLLIDTVSSWKADERHELRVVFPPTDREAVERYINEEDQR